MEKTPENNKKKALGRGLGSLLAPREMAVSTQDLGSMTTQMTTQSATTQMAVSSQPVVDSHRAKQVADLSSENGSLKVWMVGVERLIPGAYQPRMEFDESALEELAASIREVGVLQPILGRKLQDGHIEIIAGERRWRAAQKAGLKEVPVILQNLKDIEALEIALIENLQREDLNPIEEAEAYERLASEFKLTHAQVAQKVGKDRVTVSNSLRLLTLPGEIRSLIGEGKLSSGHAKVLLGIKEPKDIKDWAIRSIDEGLSVRQLEKLAFRERKTKSEETDAKKILAVHQIEENLQKSLGFPIEIKYVQGKGKLLISFNSDQELETLVRRISK